MAKKYRTERRRINARDVATVIHNPAAVDYYKKHPHGTYDRGLFATNGGRPSVGRGRGGKLVAWEGNHRIAARAAQGQKIDVDFHVEIGSDDDTRSGGFLSWLFK